MSMMMTKMMKNQQHGGNQWRHANEANVTYRFANCTNR